MAAYTQFYITQLFNNEVRNAIQLRNNSARYGGALYVDDRTYKGTCSSGAGKSSTGKYNASSVDFKNSSIMDISLSECFFQVVMMTSKNYTFSDAFTYSGNAANVSGPLLYGGLLDRCTLYVFSDSHHIQFSQTPRSSSSIYNITSSSPVRVCPCNNSVVNCEHQKVQVFVSKGEWFSLHVTAVDQMNRSTNATIHKYLAHSLSSLKEGSVKISQEHTCKELTFTVTSRLDTEQLILFAEGPCNSLGISNFKVTIDFGPCKFNVLLDSKLMKCETCVNVCATQQYYLCHS